MAQFITEIVRVSNPRTKMFDAITEDGGSGPSIQISGGELLGLPADSERLSRLIPLLESAQQDGERMFVKANDGKLEKVRPTISGHVLAIEETGAGDFEIEISNSHAVHVLRREEPRFEELAETLRSAEKQAYPVEIVNARGIVEVRRLSQKSVLTEEVGPPTGGDLLTETWADKAEVDVESVKKAFEAIVGLSCDVSHVNSTCIPFLYPTDYCWSRAHAMARILVQEFGITPAKAWTRGRLRAATRNDHDCYVRWGWHVAPLVHVAASGGGDAEAMVLDPSMFDEPVTLDVWVQAQGDDDAKVTTTDWQIYNYTRRGKAIRDEDFRYVDGHLRKARRALLSEMEDYGAPPYAHCQA